MAVYYSSIKWHKLKMRVELKERKILDSQQPLWTIPYIDNSQLHTSYGLSNYVQFHLYYHVHEYYILVLQICYLNLIFFQFC